MLFFSFFAGPVTIEIYTLSYTTLFRSNLKIPPDMRGHPEQSAELPAPGVSDDGSGTACALECARVLSAGRDRKSTRLNSSHRCISYAVFCLKKKTKAPASR